MLHDPILTEPAAEEDLALARLVMKQASPETIAAALIRLHRSRLPAPEELFDPGESRGGGRQEQGPRERPERRREERGGGQGAMDAVWFRLGVGRAANADPKWLIPLICRRGHVTKKDIGQIRIFDRETKFEISTEAAGRFAAAIAAAPAEPIRIEPAGAPGPKTAVQHDARPVKRPPSRKKSNAARR